MKLTAGNSLEVVLAVIGRAHGVRGQVHLEVRTDQPSRRFQLGQAYATDPASAGPLTLSFWREQSGTTVAGFGEVPDRTAAEALRGVSLVAQVDPTEEDDAWYPAQLTGLDVHLPDGTAVGQVSAVLTRPAQDLLEIDQPEAGPAWVPLVRQLVPVVDLDGGRIVIDPPAGLVAARGLDSD